MKKIALLLTILSASILTGMESTGDMWGNIPQEAKAIIISYLNTYDTLNDIINTIKATSRTNRQLNKMVSELYGNPTGFRDLIQLLAKKFPKENPKTIAEKFGTTAAAKNYLQLSEELHQAFKSNNFIDLAKPLIQKGADINYQSPEHWPLVYKAIIKGNLETIEFLLKNNADPNSILGPKKKAFLPEEESPLILVTWRAFTPTTLETIKLLIKYGADVNFKNSKGNTALDTWIKRHRDADPAVEQLLKEAMQK